MQVFVAIAGQDDNLGDSVLRRGLLDTLAPLGHLHIFVGTASQDYLSAFDLPFRYKLYRRRSSWYAAMTRAALRGPVVYGFNAGEIQVVWRTALHYVLQIPIVALVRARGGYMLHGGFGVRSKRPIMSLAMWPVLRMANRVFWRDQKSRDWMRIGDIAPDWAFLYGEPEKSLGTRDSVLLSLRGSNPEPGEAYLKAVGDFARQMGRTIKVVSQVSRDDDLALKLASYFSSPRPVLTVGHSHRTLEAAVRETYRRSQYVISDRLHVLILAATEGSIPVLFTPQHDDKLLRTMTAAGFAFEAFKYDHRIMIAKSGRLENAACDAQSRLGSLQEEIQAEVKSLSESHDLRRAQDRE